MFVIYTIPNVHTDHLPEFSDLPNTEKMKAAHHMWGTIKEDPEEHEHYCGIAASRDLPKPSELTKAQKITASMRLVGIIMKQACSI